MKYYTAVGRYELRKDDNGLKSPVLICNGKEYTPTISEMAMWTMLMWHILEYRELKEAFCRKRTDMHIFEDLSPDYYLTRLEKLGYLRSGTGCTAADALYNLVAPLYLIPATASFFVKVCSFFHLFLVKGVPFRIAWRIFKKDHLSLDEELVMSLASQNTLSTAELICCIDQNLDDVSDDAVMANVYASPEVTCDNLPAYTRASYRLVPVLQAVTNLYLKRLITFEQC